MRITIQLPDTLVAQADRAAKAQRVSRSEFIAKAIRSYIRHHDDDKITEELNRVYSTESSALDPVFEEMQARTQERFREQW